jgi:signal transduction histidine kinase
LRHRKQILLFLVAVLIPSLTLIFFAQKILRQDKELAQKRAADARRRLALEVGREVRLRLEALEFEVSRDEAAIYARPDAYAPPRPEVVAVGRVEGGRPLLPWECGDASVRALGESLEAPAVAASIREGERAEFARKDPARALDFYRKAMGAATGEGKTYVRLLLARALAKSGRAAPAAKEYEALLDLSPRERDEDGMPIYLYAADRLAANPRYSEKVAARLVAALAEKPWLSLPEVGLVTSLADRIAGQAEAPDRAVSLANDLQTRTAAYRAKAEHLLAVREDLERLLPGRGNGGGSIAGGPPWTVDAHGEWLLGLGPEAGDRRLFFIVDIHALNDSLLGGADFRRDHPGEFRLAASGASGGDTLGPELPGLYLVSLGAAVGADAISAASRPFYLLATAAAIVFAGLGGYLLWRDVRRDLDLAEMRSQFAASVSHELKTPLTAIRMFAETVRLGRLKDEAARAEYLDTIINESERLSRLLNNVLDLSRIEQGRKLYHPRPQPLAPILRAAARTMDYPLKQQGFALDVAIDESLPDVLVDADALEQALLNLIGNAIKYSGGARAIGLELVRDGGWAVVRVSDHGVGIAPADRQRIFEKFYRAPTPENRQVPGTGLGLALVAHFVKEHGGRVEVASEPGRGSAFSLYLPLEAGT